MSLSRLISSRAGAAILCAGLISSSSFAQNAQTAQPAASTPPSAPQPQTYKFIDYSKPRSPFPNIIAPYESQNVPSPNLANTARIDQLLHDGKIMLSMDDAVALALENNLDIAIARYNLNIADTDLLRAHAGSSILGGNFGVVQNTPGGGVGGLGTAVGSGAGGTSARS